MGKQNIINFPGASTQTPQGYLSPATQDRRICPNLATLGISLYNASIGELNPPVIKSLKESDYKNNRFFLPLHSPVFVLSRMTLTII